MTACGRSFSTSPLIRNIESVSSLKLVHRQQTGPARRLADDAHARRRAIAGVGGLGVCAAATRGDRQRECQHGAADEHCVNRRACAAERAMRTASRVGRRGRQSVHGTACCTRRTGADSRTAILTFAFGLCNARGREVVASAELRAGRS